MAFYNEFPGTRTYDGDLGWLIESQKKVLEAVSGLSDDVSNICEELASLKAYVDNKFNSNLTQAVSDKLDSMSASGQLDNIISNDLLPNFNAAGEAFDYDAYKSAILDTALGYLINSVGSSCIVGTPTRSTPFLAKYKDGNTYMGLLGQGTFTYTDTDNYNGNNYPVMYLDCSGFVSLLTKNIKYVKSPYYMGFNGQTPTVRSAQASGAYFTDTFTMDFSNKILTYLMAEICESVGMPLKLLGTWGETLTTTENVESLRTGDIIFFGTSSRTDRYKGIHHCAIYLKDLSEINALAQSFGVSVRAITHPGADLSLGYILHVDGDEGAGNVIKIEDLWHRMKPANSSDAEYTYACRAFPFVGTSNKYNFTTLGTFYYYNKMAITGKYNAGYEACANNYPPTVPVVDEYYKLSANNIASGRGQRLARNSSLDNIQDGVYFSDTSDISSTITNAPWSNSSFYLEQKGSLENPDRYGIQLAFAYSNIQNRFAYRIRNYQGTWGQWNYPA